MIYTFGDDMRLTAMIYQACGLDKKTTGRNLSFFVLYRLNRCHPKKVNKIKGFRYLSRFLSASLIDANLNFNKIWLKFSTKGVDKTN